MGRTEPGNFLFKPEFLPLPFRDLDIIRRRTALPFLDLVGKHLMLPAKFCQMRRNRHFVLLFVFA